jgi:hypothetical protein
MDLTLLIDMAMFDWSEIWGSDSSVLLGCDAVSQGERFRAFEMSGTIHWTTEHHIPGDLCLKIENVSDKSCRKNETHILCPGHFSLNLRDFKEVKQKAASVPECLHCVYISWQVVCYVHELQKMNSGSGFLVAHFMSKTIDWILIKFGIGSLYQMLSDKSHVCMLLHCNSYILWIFCCVI